ncbi:hypothetical protein M231_02734 [Tremella mesenterica]|uniref:F-box domain-containing protein n=1 Tax=Tremella mesenterica TaxID=5217 RepID=A0A4Q1BPV0_TREME|nr:hypothetical protein M231_02734 [Tremella mesenterica]
MDHTSDPRLSQSRQKVTERTLEHLPDDVLSQVLDRLSLPELLSLQQLNSSLHQRILHLGIPLYLSHHPQSHLTLHPPVQEWSPLSLLKLNTSIDRSLSTHRWRALQVGQTWSQKVIPALALSSDKLLLGVGGKLIVHPLRPFEQARHPEDSIEEEEVFNSSTLNHPDTTSGSYEGGNKKNNDDIRKNNNVDWKHDEDWKEHDGKEEKRSQIEKEGPKVLHRAIEHSIVSSELGSAADIIGLACLSSEEGGDVVVAQYDGTIRRFSLSSNGRSIRHLSTFLSPSSSSSSSSSSTFNTSSARQNPNLDPNSTVIEDTNQHETNPIPWRDISQGIKNGLHTLSHTKSLFLTTTSTSAHLYHLNSPNLPPTTYTLPSSSSSSSSSSTLSSTMEDSNNGKGEIRIWSSLLSSYHQSLFLGLSTSISIHPFSSSLKISSSSRILYGPEEPLKSSAYSIRLPPDNTHDPNLLLSSWYDSCLRIHDLREKSSGNVMEMNDPYSWADGSAMYSCCWIGSFHVAGGGSRHGTVALFDLRFSKKPLSIVSPTTSNMNQDGIGDYSNIHGNLNSQSHFTSTPGNSSTSPSSSNLRTITSISNSKSSSNLHNKSKSAEYNENQYGWKLKPNIQGSFPKQQQNSDWSLFSPGGRGSPVYSMISSSGRIYGVTEKRSFVLSFDNVNSTDEIVHSSARANQRKSIDTPYSYRSRGGRWGWTVRYGEYAQVDRSVGYQHGDRAVRLFESLS